MFNLLFSRIIFFSFKFCPLCKQPVILFFCFLRNHFRLVAHQHPGVAGLAQVQTNQKAVVVAQGRGKFGTVS